MMINPLVSVVLPIYNVEKYLDRCMQTIVNQTYRNLEIIMVDDGSPDNCPKICDEWAKKDARVKVVHKVNAGLGMARNTGIENATGDYICFFDSDDYVSLDVIEKSVTLAQKWAAEIVVFGFNNVSAAGNIMSSFSPWAEQEVFEGDSVINDFLPEYIAPNPAKKSRKKFYMSSCMLLYSFEMIKSSGWRFASEREIISEDIYALVGLFTHVKKIAVLPEALYYYCDNSSSLSRSYKPERYEKIKHFYFECLKLCDSLGYGDNIKHRVSKHYLAFTISALKQEYASSNSYIDRKRAAKKIIDDEILQKVLHKSINDVDTKARKLLFFAIRNKMYFLCYLLCQMRIKHPKK